MARLPQPGGDAGNWGDILNDYLTQSLKSDGTLKADAVTANTIADGAIANTKLSSTVQTSLGRADAAYQKPSGGIPLSDAKKSDWDGAYAAVGTQMTAGTGLTGGGDLSASRSLALTPSVLNRVTQAGTGTINVLDYGAKADVSDAWLVSTTSGSTTVTSTGFPPSINGKVIILKAAGPSGGYLRATITFVNSTTITLSTASSATLTNVKAVIGTDSTAAFQSAIDASAPFGAQSIVIPAPSGGQPGYSYLITDTLSIQHNGVCFIGNTGLFNSQSRLLFVPTSTGSGLPMFQIGIDNGNPHDMNDYSGYQGTRFEDLFLCAPLGDSAMANPTISDLYRGGTKAIVDWRGGDIHMDRCTIQWFDNGFWAIASDMNTFMHSNFYQCNVGIYAGPRTDQFTIISNYLGGCNQAVWLDTASQTRFIACQFVDCGGTSINPIKLGNQGWSTSMTGTVFESCWFEQLIGGTVEAFIEMGVGDSGQTTDIVISNAIVLNNTAASGVHVSYFVKLGNANRVAIRYPLGASLYQFTAFYKAVGSTIIGCLLDTNVWVDGNVTVGAPMNIDTSSYTGTNARCSIMSWGSGSSWGFSVNGLTTTRPIIEKPNVFSGSGSVTFNLGSLGSQIYTLTGNITSSTITNASLGQRFTIMWRQDATGGRTYVWPGQCKFAGGSAPAASTLANYTDTVTFIWDGANAIEISRSIGIH